MQAVGGIVLFLVFAAGTGFNQAFGFGFVQVVFVMLACVPLAAAITDRLLYPLTRERFRHDTQFASGFLIGVSVLAFVAFTFGRGNYDRVESDISRYAAIWFHMFPMACIIMASVDRAFDAFGGRPKPEAELPRAPMHPRKAPEPEEEKVVSFDPKRFR